MQVGRVWLAIIAILLFTISAASFPTSPADGEFPVLVLAHSGLRANPHAAGWIAAHLAKHRNIVIVAQPPVLGSGDAKQTDRGTIS